LNDQSGYGYGYGYDEHAYYDYDSFNNYDMTTLAPSSEYNNMGGLRKGGGKRKKNEKQADNVKKWEISDALSREGKVKAKYQSINNNNL
jgi:hypothetical protein